MCVYTCTLCIRPNSSSLREPGDRRSIIPYISSGLCDVSRTSATAKNEFLSSIFWFVSFQKGNRQPKSDLDKEKSDLSYLSIFYRKVSKKSTKNSPKTSQSRPRLRFFGSPLIPTKQCSFPWFNQWPVRPVRINRCSWFVLTHMSSSTRL